MMKIAGAIAFAAILMAVVLQQVSRLDLTGLRHFDLVALTHFDLSMFRMRKGNDDALTFTPQDRDLVIRTIYGESVHEPRLGQMAVAWVIRNRLENNPYGWDSLAEVVTHCGFVKRKGHRIKICQFEPWLDREDEMKALDPESGHYHRIGSVVDDVLEGRTEDPTDGAWYFLNVKTVQARRKKEGRDMPQWAKNCTDIGLHSFCKPDEQELAVRGLGPRLFSGLMSLINWVF